MNLHTHNKTLVDFLISNTEAIPTRFYGKQYRASAYLEDGTYLPCVLFSDRNKMLALYEERLNELQAKTVQFRQSLGSFTMSGSRVDSYDIAQLEVSKYAMPQNWVNKIIGETSMGWTCFVVEMKDGKLFNYGTSFAREFFNVPLGYTFADFNEIYSDMIAMPDGTVVSGRGANQPVEFIRERSHFICYLDGLD